MIRLLVLSLVGCVIVASLAVAQWMQPMMMSFLGVQITSASLSGLSYTSGSVSGTAVGTASATMIMSSVGVRITSVSLSGLSYTSGAVSGTAVGTASATLSSGSFTVPPGSWNTSGTNATEFSFSGSSLQTNGSTPTCSVITTIPLTISANYPGVSSLTQAETITCNPSGGGGVPGPAAAAGFTQNVMNADFSQPSYANLANWLDGCGGPTSGFRWSARLFGNNGAPPPCSQIDIEPDATIGNTPVLHFHQDPTSSITQTPGIFWPSPPYTDNGNYMAPEAYNEILFRVTSTSMTQGTNVFDVFSYYFTSGPNHSNVWENDFIEAQPNTTPGWLWSDGALEYCNGVVCGGIFSSPPNGIHTDISTYHTIGILFTSDGTTQVWKCYYLDGNNIGCGGDTGLHDPTILQLHDLILVLKWANTGNITNPIDIYIQKVSAWECPAWPSQPCPGPLVMN